MGTSQDLVGPILPVSLRISCHVSRSPSRSSACGWRFGRSPPRDRMFPIEPGSVRVRLERMERKIRHDVPFDADGPWRKSDLLCGERDPVLAMEGGGSEKKEGCGIAAKRTPRPVEVPTGAVVVAPLCFSLPREGEREPEGRCHRTDRSTNHRARGQILPYPLAWEIRLPIDPPTRRKGGSIRPVKKRGNGIPSRIPGV